MSRFIGPSRPPVQAEDEIPKQEADQVEKEDVKEHNKGKEEVLERQSWMLDESLLEGTFRVDPSKARTFITKRTGETLEKPVSQADRDRISRENAEKEETIAAYNAIHRPRSLVDLHKEQSQAGNATRQTDNKRRNFRSRKEEPEYGDDICDISASSRRDAARSKNVESDDSDLDITDDLHPLYKHKPICDQNAEEDPNQFNWSRDMDGDMRRRAAAHGLSESFKRSGSNLGSRFAPGTGARRFL